VFISHAWEDKADFVRLLAKRLIDLGIKVWFDEFSLEIGDSLRENIDRGLAASDYGIVVLSQSFFAKHWPERELNGLVQKATIHGRKVILPVWHGVTHEMVAEYSLPLADLLAAHSSNGVEHVSAEIVRVIHGASARSANSKEDLNAESHVVRGGAVTPPIHEQRAAYSRSRLVELQRELGKLSELQSFPALTVFAAGSYARLEASEHSDIDLFFVKMGGEVVERNTKELRLFGKIIEIADRLHYPKFSNDCQYLAVLNSEDIAKNLGSPTDDHENYFTARMLLLLEGHCLYGEQVYEKLMAEMVNAYFQDYPDHRHTFQPVFLLNDICRYWKTLLLNYEHRRLPRTADMEAARTRQKVRNFKLKYSRMTTCFASIGALGSYQAPVAEEQVVALAKMTPRQRLESISIRVPAARSAVADVLGRYNWFLEMTGLSVGELEDRFSDKQKRTEMFREANEYGDAMYRLLQALDAANKRMKLLRYLVI
jgi:predicted nucleotidyltransferase